MSWTLDVDMLDDLARGAAFLGTGGGGDPYIGRLLAEAAIREHGPLTVLDPDELDDDMFIVPTAQMGAPTVIMERIPAGREPEAALAALESHVGRSADATMPIECGGINSMIPLLVAARTGLPVVDADGMGRAFPELQMETFAAYGVPGSPLAIADERGHSVIIDAGRDNAHMEWLARGVTIRLGGAAHIAEYSMSGAEAKRTAVPRTLSLALTVGRALGEARGPDTVRRLREALAPTLYSHAVLLFAGKVTDVARRTDRGFTLGEATVTNEDEAHLVIRFQNENLVATANARVVASVPDLICIVEADTAEPITTERIRFGQRVRVFGVSTPEMMRTPAALEVFGPRAFGLDNAFVPVERLAGPGE